MFVDFVDLDGRLLGTAEARADGSWEAVRFEPDHLGDLSLVGTVTLESHPSAEAALRALGG